MKKLEKGNIPEEIKKHRVYLYGAGYTAKVCLNTLKDSGITIKALIDDDSSKIGTKVESFEVISYEEFRDMCKDEVSANVILTSIYGKQILNKLIDISNIIIWEMYEWYTELLNQQDVVIDKYCEGERLRRYKENTDKLKKYLADEESKNVFDGVYQYYKTKDINKLVDICTEEECYFTKEVREYFKDREISLIDAGAYEGELLRAIISSGLNVKDWYCFELEKMNFDKLRGNLSKATLPKKLNCICENLGLWDEKDEFSITGNGAGSKIAEGTNDERVCMVDTIDHYFQDIHVDLIKMNIEGAEMRAIRGGIQTIRRDHPLLAISIYHCAEDYYRIMQFLLDNVKGYNYYIRQHALIYGETVLYAVPCC